MSGSRGKCRCRRISPRLRAAESLGADFIECLDRTAEIGAAVDAVSEETRSKASRANLLSAARSALVTDQSS